MDVSGTRQDFLGRPSRMVAGCVHLCRVEGNTLTLCDPIWQVTLRSCEMVFHEQLYIYLFSFYLYLLPLKAHE